MIDRAPLREVRNHLQDIVDGQPNAADVPIALARAVSASVLTLDQKRAAFSTLRSWTN